MTETDIKELSIPRRFMNRINHDLEYVLDYGIEDLDMIVLFGSCAKGTVKITSDVDLLIVTEDQLSRDLRGDISSELEVPVEGVSTDVVFYTSDNLNKSDKLFSRLIRKDGVILWKRE